MRGDLQAGDLVTLPPGILITLSQGAVIPSQGSEQRTNLSLSGSGVITKVLHIGDFRNPDGVGWSTTYDVSWPRSESTGQTTPAEQVEQSNQDQNPNNEPPSSEPPQNQPTEAPPQD
jgi:hypothetical protein